MDMSPKGPTRWAPSPSVVLARRESPRDWLQGFVELALLDLELVRHVVAGFGGEVALVDFVEESVGLGEAFGEGGRDGGGVGGVEVFDGGLDGGVEGVQLFAPGCLLGFRSVGGDAGESDVDAVEEAGFVRRGWRRVRRRGGRGWRRNAAGEWRCRRSGTSAR